MYIVVGGQSVGIRGLRCMVVEDRMENGLGHREAVCCKARKILCLCSGGVGWDTVRVLAGSSSGLHSRRKLAWSCGRGLRKGGSGHCSRTLGKDLAPSSSWSASGSQS